MELRQRFSLSPTIFNLQVSGMVEELEGARMGIKIDDKWCAALFHG